MDNLEDKKVLTISELINCINKGMLRDEIQDHFELSHTEMKEVFSHPKLKGRRAKKAPSIKLVDDTVKNENGTLEKDPTSLNEELEEERNIEGSVKDSENSNEVTEIQHEDNPVGTEDIEEEKETEEISF